MDFTVREWMNDLVVYVDPDALVVDALALMRRRYLNCLIVKKSEHNSSYGIITTTDVSDKIIAQERDPAQTRVRDIMVTPVFTIPWNMSLIDCAKKFEEHNIHHLPVVNDAGDLVGMISADDFLVAAEAYGRAGERALR
jgi:CBS domain-containing protein